MNINGKHKTIELLEKKKKNIWGLGLSKKFSDLTPKA